MKLINLIIASLILFSCTQNQENNDITKTVLTGKWHLSDIKIMEKDTLENMEMLGILLILGESDFKYIKFTDDNKLQILKSNDELLDTKNYKLIKHRLVLNSKNKTDSVKLIRTGINSIKLVFENGYEYYFEKETETHFN